MILADKYDILKAEHDVLRESGEFGFDLEGCEYFHYVEGVLDLAEKIIESMDGDSVQAPTDGSIDHALLRVGDTDEDRVNMFDGDMAPA